MAFSHLPGGHDLVASVQLRSQGRGRGGSISGTVTDSSGAAVTNATVTITNTQTQVQRTVPTNESGFYSVPNLLPGKYEISTSARGFKTLVRSGITLDVGGEVVVDLPLELGQVNESVRVTGDVPDVEQSSSTLDYTVNATTVRELPLNGRDWTQLSLLIF